VAPVVVICDCVEEVDASVDPEAVYQDVNFVLDVFLIDGEFLVKSYLDEPRVCLCLKALSF